VSGLAVDLYAETVDGFGEVEADWEALADRVGAPPWLRPGWMAAWWAAFGRGTPSIVTVRRDGRLVGVLPLAARFGVLASMTNWHTPEFGPVVEPGDEAALVDTVLAGRPRQVRLAFADPERPAVAAWQAAVARRGYRVLVRTLERSPYVAVDADWERFDAQLHRGLKANLARRRRRLEEKAQVTVEVEDGRVGLNGLLEEGFRVEAAGWKGTGGSAIDSDTATRRFYTDVATWASERGWLRLAFLRVGSRAIAFDFALEVAGVHYLLKTGYDPAYQRFGPGMLLRYELLARAFATGLDRYEFLGADEQWKLQWTSTAQERILIQSFSPSLPGRAEAFAYARTRPLVKRALSALR
jgi:CelD/BcsL family acetyltransferase involved in cellulose biosynthesis